jgi:hypothetical protein
VRPLGLGKSGEEVRNSGRRYFREMVRVTRKRNILETCAEYGLAHALTEG